MYPWGEGGKEGVSHGLLSWYSVERLVLQEPLQQVQPIFVQSIGKETKLISSQLLTSIKERTIQYNSFNAFIFLCCLLCWILLRLLMHCYYIIVAFTFCYSFNALICNNIIILVCTLVLKELISVAHSTGTSRLKTLCSSIFLAMFLRWACPVSVGGEGTKIDYMLVLS